MNSITVNKKGIRRLQEGHPWVFRSDITGVDANVVPGDIVNVRNASGTFFGQGIYNSNSMITFRLLTKEMETVDKHFFRHRIFDAWQYRQQFCDTSCCRVVHSEADLLPALIVDKFSDVLVMQSLSLGLERYQDIICDALMECTGAAGIYERNDVSVRRLEGLEESRGVLRGSFDTMVPIVENGVQYLVDVAQGQKTGYFLDQKENRAAIQPFVGGKQVLDCFTHVGSFALNAAAFGAEHILAIDISQSTVDMAKGNAARNSFGNRCEFVCANAFDALRDMQLEGRTFDCIVLDPPAFAKNRDSVKGAYRGYKEINLRALKMLKKGGVLITCSCSHHMSEDLFLKMVEEASLDARKQLRLIEKRTQAKDHPVLIGVPETQYLKCMIFMVLND